MTASRHTLFIHIGHPKTGTSSIQTALAGHREELLRQGICVPMAGFTEGAHYGLGQNWYSIRNREDDSGACIAEMKREIRKSGCKTAVISNEGFIQENPRRLAAMAGDDTDVFIIYYIRRQDLMVESVYAQRVRSGVQRALESPQSLLPYLVPHYDRILARFSEVFDRSHILVRPFEKASFRDGSLIADFLGLIGAAPLSAEKAERRQNTAFRRHYLEFKRACNGLPLLDDEHEALNAELSRLSDSDTTPHPRHLFSYDERMSILQACSGSNANLAREYLGRSDGSLFLELPPPDDGDFRPFGLPDPATQHRILDGLNPKVREKLAFLDVRIRLRLPGTPFLEEPPNDPIALRRLVLNREQLRLRRRMAAVEFTYESRKAAGQHKPGVLERLFRKFDFCHHRKSAGTSSARTRG